MNSPGKPPEPLVGRNDPAELRELVIRAQPFLQPGFSELLSEETRKAQRSLLVVAFGLVLLAAEAITVSGPFKFLGLNVAIQPKIILYAGFAICLYLEALVAIRCFSDWKLHLLQTKIPDIELKSMFEEQVAAKSGTTKRWFLDVFFAFYGSRNLRFAIEIFFPIGFGLFALVMCIWAFIEH
jgi:hypothetical protein